MQIAQIVPKVKTKDEGIFDYSIPPSILPVLKNGILVEVPFHGRNIEGILVGIKRYSKITNLKDISKIIDPVPVIGESQIKLAAWMSNYYLSSLGKTLFEFVVPPAKRTIKNTGKSIFIPRATKIVKNNFLKKYLIISDFSKRLKFYLQAIDKTLERHRTIIILVPDLSLIPLFKKYIKNPVTVLHANLTKTQRWTEWNKIRCGDVKIVIGSQSAIFAPLHNLGLIIIDQEENQTYKNDRSPRFHAVDVANMLAEYNNANLILGSIAPRVETYYQAINKRYRLIKTPVEPTKNILIDMNSEKYVISNTLEKEIEIAVAKKEKILLVLNRKGDGTKFSCIDCAWIALCQKCGLPLIPQKHDAVCYRCEKSYDLPAFCPKCKNINLKAKGLGTAKLKKFLYDLFPNVRIIQIEKEGKARMNDNWDIAITTSFGLKFHWPKIGLVGIIDADQSLNLPDYNSSQKTFITLYKFLRIGERGIIQTHLPENQTIASLANPDYEKFFLGELNERKIHHFPPFIHLLKLIYKNIDNEAAKKESQRVYHLLRKFDNNLSLPYPPFIKKDKNKFRYQIVLKFKNNLNTEIKNLLRSLPDGWSVDVDPVNLL